MPKTADVIRRHWKIWSSAAAILLIAAGTWWFVAAHRRNPEPRTPAEVLAKTKWSDAELARCMVRTAFAKEDQPTKEKMFAHLKRQYEARERSRQLNVIREGARFVLDELIAKYRAMPPEKRLATVKFISMMMKKAPKHPPRNAGPPPGQKRDLEAEKIVQEEILHAVNQKLTSRERAELSPILTPGLQFLQRYAPK